MSELFDKEVNEQKESLKKFFRGSRKLPQAHKKCVMKMKHDACIKMLLMEGSTLKAPMKNR